MNFSFIKELITSTWMVDALTVQIYAPVLHGVFKGLMFERENPNKKDEPYSVSVSLTGKQTSGSNEQSVFVQPINGVMMKHNTESGIIGTRTMADNLLHADKNPNIIGHILKIESGGGQATAVPELTDAIKKLSKPIVAFVDGCMCSAAMYAGSYCNKIIASRETDMIGCIGTMIELAGFPKFNKEPDGYTTVRIYADEATEKNDEYEAAITGDFKLVKERMLNPHNQQFINDILLNRPGVKKEHLKGKTFNAAEVIGTLIDSIGNFQSAIDAVVELNKSKSHSKKSINMGKQLKLTALLTLLAVTELASEDGNSSLNEQQLEAIDNALDAGNKAQTDLAAANTNLQTANSTIADLNDKIKELEKAAGAQSATVVTETDSNNETNELNRYQQVRNELKGKK
jgi:protease-4